MARWRLTQPHYLNTIPAAKYRYEETDRDTGERNIQEYEVPRLLDPNSPKDCRSKGDCVVCDGTGIERGDWIFIGDPTPDMEPLDDTARAISDSFKDRWARPIDDLPTQGGFSSTLLANFEKQLAEAVARSGSIQPTPIKGVDPAEFETLKEQIAQLVAQNEELRMKLTPSRRS